MRQHGIPGEKIYKNVLARDHNPALARKRQIMIRLKR